MRNTQFVVVVLATLFGVAFIKKRIRGKLIVGTVEIANVLSSFETSDLKTYTVCLYPNFRYTEKSYSFLFRGTDSPRLDYLRRLILGPWLLGLGLIGKSDFLLLGEKSFLEDRRMELLLIRFFGRKSAVSFLGDDIRSPHLTRKFMREKGLDTFVNSSWYAFVDTNAHEYEVAKKKIASVNQSNADLILTSPYDQLSYLDLEFGNVILAHGFVALGEESFNASESKFDSLQTLKIVHAPTDTDVKGTNFVRSAIEQLRHEGYAFEYQELIDVSHLNVRKALFESHICLNQFRGLGMGVLGIESMAARCVTFMSALPNLEPSIPKPHSQSWVETMGLDLLDNLRVYVANPDLLKNIAANGYSYALNNYSTSKSSLKLKGVLRNRGFVC